MSSITLWGAVYDTDYVDLPKTGGGTARFSEGGGGSVTWELMADQTCTITTYDGMRIITIDGYTEPFSADETYRVTWNDTQYICKTYAESQGITYDGYVIGNSAIVNNGSDSGEPFIMYRTRATRLTGATNDTTSSSVYVKIEKQVASSATLITKTITANGTYNASSDGADGYSSVTVNVPSSAASSWTKVAETTYQVSTTGTSAATVATWATGHSEIWTSDKWVYVRIRDTAGKRAGYFYGSDQFFYNSSLANGGASPTYISTALRIYLRYSGTTITPTPTTGSSGYGVWADYLYPNGRIRIRQRYNSSYSLTVDGTYKVEVYLLDPAGGVPIFT